MKKIIGSVLIISLFWATPASAATLTHAQINAVIGLLIAFGVEQGIIQNVRVAMEGTSATPAPIPSPAPVFPVQTPAPNPVPAPSVSPQVNNGPIPTEISVQSSVCNLSSSNLKTDYLLSDLLQQGNTDGRIFMNAFVLDQHGKNYFANNPAPVMTITTSDHSNDKMLKGSGSTGPCGFYYSYQFYTTAIGMYTVTYSIPTLNLSKSVTITVTGPEKPVISSSGFTVSTPQKETDYPLSERSNFGDSSNIKYWFQASKPASYISAQCSDADTPFTKVDVVSSLDADGFYYPRGWFSSGSTFSGTTVCKLIHSTDYSITIFSESDLITMTVQ